MLGIYKNNDLTWCRWFQAWFDILNYLVSILTFSYFYMDIASWLYYDEDHIFGKSFASPTIGGRHYSIRRRLRWSFRYCINILEELFVILTLGYLTSNWEQYVLREGERCDILN